MKLGGQEQHGDSGNPTLPTFELRREGPENEGNSGRDRKGCGEEGQRRGGSTERGKDGHQGQKGHGAAQCADTARGDRVKQSEDKRQAERGQVRGTEWGQQGKGDRGL